MKVRLNPFEMRFARKLGQTRQERREAAGNRNAHGSRGGAEDHVLGVMGEMAFAKIANRYPTGLFLDKDEDDDVGGIQVRTRRKAFQELYLWKRDETDCYWALMTGEGPEFTFHGLIHGTEAAIEAHWTTARYPFPRVDCFVVPHEKLKVELLGNLADLAVSA